MSGTASVRIFVNGRPLDAVSGEPAIAAIERADSGTAASLRRGARALTDSRGLPVPVDTPAFAGAIFRVVSSRAARDPGTGSGTGS